MSLVRQVERLSGDGASNAHWYCVHTAPAREALAADFLQSRNVRVYHPLLPGRAGTPRQRPQPLFPRYLFACFALNSQFDAVRYARGVSYVVSDMDGPLAVPDIVIEEIRTRLECGAYSDELVRGDHVVVDSGVFKGLTGIFQGYATGPERVRVLMELMNRSVFVELDLGAIRNGRPRRAIIPS